MDWQSGKARLTALMEQRTVRGMVERTVGVVARVQRMHPLQRFLTIALVAAILLVPVLGAASAVQDYLQLRTLGADAVHHLLAAKNALVPSQGTTSSLSASCGTTTQPTPRASATTTRSATATPTTVCPAGNDHRGCEPSMADAVLGQ